MAMKKAKPPVKKAPKLSARQVKGQKKANPTFRIYLK